MIEKRLGKIESVNFGFGGYDGAMIGLSFVLGDGTWGVNDFKGTWGMEPSESAKWTVADQTRVWGETVRFMRNLLQEAKVETVDQLKDKPVEVTFEGQQLKSWRLLTEVI